MLLNNFPEILQMPADKKIELVEEICDNIENVESEIPIPDWHKDIIEKRLQTLDMNNLFTLDELKQRIENRR